MSSRKLGAIILAAGRGSRMNSKNQNKVTLQLANKPIILHAIELLEKMKFQEIVVVVGFAKNSVIQLLNDAKVIFVEQRVRLGTAHAVKTALPKINPSITDVLIIQGDDSAFYGEDVISQLAQRHFATNAALTFLTINVNNPFGLGRVLRNKEGQVTAMVEEKDATDDERKINEVNPACYIFSVNFLKKYLSKVKKSPVTGEYYLPSLIDIAMHNNEKIETVQAGFMPWRGVNTPDELAEAEQLYQQFKTEKANYAK